MNSAKDGCTANIAGDLVFREMMVAGISEKNASTVVTLNLLHVFFEKA